MPWYRDRTTWRFLAFFIDLAYDFPSESLDQAVARMGGNGTVIGSDGDWMPRTFFVTNGKWQLFYSAGSTADQLALQSFAAGLGPVPIGGYATNIVHWQAANVTIDRLNAAGFDPALPTIFAGHSYGGAIAQLVASRMQQAHPDARYRVVTFGAPRVGDEATAALVSQVPSAQLVTRGDPVPDLPPNLDVLSWVPSPVPAPLVDAWSAWRSPPTGRVIIEQDGTLTFSQEQATTWGDYWSAIQQAIAGDPITLPQAHEIKTYLLRLTP